MSELVRKTSGITLGDVTVPVDKVNPADNPDHEIEYIDISSIDNASLKIVATKRLSGKDAPSRARQRVQHGDVVFSTVRPYLKNIAYVPESLHDEVASTGFCVLRPSPSIFSRYLYYFVQTDDFLRGVYALQRGVSYPAVRNEDVLSQPAPYLPSIEIQKAVVAEIEKQFSRLDEAVAALKRIQANLKRYKAAVLKAAVEGKLTEQWRKDHPGVEPANQLLKRILAERRAKWETEELAKIMAKGTKPKDDSWKKKYKEPAGPDTTNLPGLPEGWVWTNFEQLAEASPNALKAGPFGSALKKEYYVPNGYKVYGQEQVISGDPFYGDYYIDQDRFDSLKSCAVKSGDILISLVGTIGKVLILPEGIESGIINPRLVKLSMNKNYVIPEFVKAYLQSDAVRHSFSTRSHGGTMDILNLSMLKELPVPLPSITEQWQLIEQIDRSFSIAEELETTIKTNLKRAERLRQTILQRAFSGGLV
ncbi:MAG: restriction endonuclease subunit S [Geobacteraceae bacterium]|nr:restriction endonuclease subunit S [Geobacteraceae bacterium]